MLKDIELQRSMELIKLSISISIRGVMAIIDIFKTEKKVVESSDEGFLSEVGFVGESLPLEEKVPSKISKGDLLSFCCVRLLFLVPFFFSICWFAFVLCKLTIYLAIHLGFFGSSTVVTTKLLKSWLSLKRAFICGVAVALALFSPALGIMIACTYFLMYDKTGIEEVIPASLREQFKDLFAQVDSN